MLERQLHSYGTRHLRVVLLAGVVAASLLLLVPPAQASASTMAAMPAMQGMPMGAPSVPAITSHREFEYLSRQHSNNCGLNPASFATMAATTRLQGACCGPMDAKLYPDYVKQIRALAHYDHRYVPANPYNMSVALARRLVEFNDTILLTPAQQRTFDRAMPMSPDKAPCCCHCWRWVAFEGQAKYFIARRNYTAREIATLWGLDDGCGDTSKGMVMTG